MATQSVEIATSADEAAVVAVMTLAFANDPITRWSWPDPRVYFEQFPRFVRAFGGNAFGHAGAHRVEGYAAAALWLPPNIHPDEEAMGALMQSTVPESVQADMFAVVEQIGRHLPRGHMDSSADAWRAAAPGAGTWRCVAEVRARSLRSRRNGGLSRIDELPERTALSAARLRDPGHHPGRPVARDHAHAAQTEEALMLRGGCFCRAVRYRSTPSRHLENSLSLHDLPSPTGRRSLPGSACRLRRFGSV
jgi:hypothetical protein